MLKIDTRGYQGSVHKSARVSSNDPARPDMQLGIQLFVKAPVTWEPKGVMLGGSTEDEVRQTVVIKAHLDTPLKLEFGENTLSEKVNFEVVPVVEGKEYQVVLKNLSRQEEDRYSGSITFKTNYPEQPQIVLYYIGYIWKPGTEIPISKDLKHQEDINPKEKNLIPSEKNDSTHDHQDASGNG